MKSLLEVLRSSTEFLEKKGVSSARLESEWLAGHILGLSRMELYLQYDRPLGEKELAPLRELVRRRGNREPLQHLLGVVEFHGRKFKSDARALIPRPETEELAEKILERFPTTGRLLDMGCGSGVLALTVAGEAPVCRVVGADISPDALELAAENAEAMALGDRVEWVQSDLFENLEGTFDGIMANLPYVAETDMASLQPEVRHDPATALAGGGDGTDLLRRMIEQTPAFLTPGGWLALEIGQGQADTLISALDTVHFHDIMPVHDIQGVEGRFLFARHG